ncbi:MAG: hypothetical protein LJF04_16035 [Gemmatimonadetes bacterium]|nr:hypothetical protein [Gemmatimonadota bacterium]
MSRQPSNAPHAHGEEGAARPPLGPRAWMKDPDEPPRIWDKKQNVARLLNALYALCAVLVVLDLVVHRHTEHPWEHVVAFYPLYGFVGIVILVLAAKGLRRLVMRPEDYYDVE